MVITLKISLGEIWSAEIEFVDLATLEDVHVAIQDAVNFDNDHLYEFFIGRNERARNVVRYTDENGAIYATRLRDIFPLPSKNKLFYLFDYGDSWLFKIGKTRRNNFEPIDNVEYPRIAKSTGEPPEQYDIIEDW